MTNYFFLNIKDGKVKVDDTLNGSYEIVKFSCPNNFYNVLQGYNTFLLYPTMFDPVQTITIPPGFYNPYDLAVVLSSLLTGIDWLINYDPKTNKFNFQRDNPFQFQFTNQKLANLFGFNVGPTGYSTQHTSSNPIDVNQTRNIFMRILEASPKIFGSSHFSATAFFNDKFSNFGDSFTWTSEYNKQKFQINTTNNLECVFFDKYGYPLDIKNSEMILRKIC